MKVILRIGLILALAHALALAQGPTNKAAGNRNNQTVGAAEIVIARSPQGDEAIFDLLNMNNRRLLRFARNDRSRVIFNAPTKDTQEADSAKVRKPKPPRFPPEDEIKKITKRQRAHEYPRFSIDVGVARGHHNNTKLNESFRRVQNVYDPTITGKFEDARASYSIGVRMRVSRTLSFLWQQTKGGDPGEDGITRSLLSLAALVTLSDPKHKWFLLSFGAGLATQRLRAHRDYSMPVSDSGSLDYIQFDSGQKAGVPLVALLEISGPDIGVFASAEYVLASSVACGTTYSYAHVDYPVTLRAEMRGWWLRFGLTIKL